MYAPELSLQRPLSGLWEKTERSALQMEEPREVKEMGG